MSYYAEYNHGMISRDELLNAFNMDRSNHDPDERMSEEELCWREGTGEGDCTICDWRFECSGSPYCEDEEDDE